MSDGVIRLRARRRTRAAGRGRNWRAPVGLTTIGLLLGVACLAPMTPSALAPVFSTDQVTSVPARPATAPPPDPGRLAGAVPGPPRASRPGPADPPPRARPAADCHARGRRADTGRERPSPARQRARGPHR